MAALRARALVAGAVAGAVEAALAVEMEDVEDVEGAVVAQG